MQTKTHLQKPFTRRQLFGSFAAVLLATAIISNAVAAERIVAWGDNSALQTNVPPGLTNVIAIAAGDSHGLALKDDGTVVAWGAGVPEYNSGQANVPQGLSNVIAIAAGRLHSLALKDDGTVVAWGYNYSGQLNVPSGLSNVVAISAADLHSLALKSDGTVVGWGDRANVPASLSNVVAISAGVQRDHVLTADGRVGDWYEQQQILRMTNAMAIASGLGHGLGISNDGTVTAWGTDYLGQPVTVPAGLSNVVAIAACGAYFGPTVGGHSLALTSDGSVVAWGRNDQGQANVPPDLSNVTAIAAAGTWSLALSSDHSPVTQATFTNAMHDSNGFHVALPTQSGRVYALEYKTSLNDSNWTALPLVAGNGANRMFSDSSTSSQRFYRVRRW
jgi:alpha-tubulin suppressor-like RCC1 family protein